MSTTKPVKVTSLAGPALDWVVAGLEGTARGIAPTAENPAKFFTFALSYTRDWSLAGPIIEREGITVGANGYKAWVAMITNTTFYGLREGPTPLIAAMRVYVASKLGDTVEIPEELV